MHECEIIQQERLARGQTFLQRHVTGHQRLWVYICIYICMYDYLCIIIYTYTSTYTYIISVYSIYISNYRSNCILIYIYIFVYTWSCGLNQETKWMQVTNGVPQNEPQQVVRQGCEIDYIARTCRWVNWYKWMRTSTHIYTIIYDYICIYIYSP